MTRCKINLLLGKWGQFEMIWWVLRLKQSDWNIRNQIYLVPEKKFLDPGWLIVTWRNVMQLKMMQRNWEFGWFKVPFFKIRKKSVKKICGIKQNYRQLVPPLGNEDCRSSKIKDKVSPLHKIISHCHLNLIHIIIGLYHIVISIVIIL